MKMREFAESWARRTKIGERFVDDRRFRIISKAVLRLIFNLFFVFYNAILGVLSGSVIFITSALYYFLLSSMRFSAVFLGKNEKRQNSAVMSTSVGIMLIILSVIFGAMVFVSMKYETAEVYGTITMITIATYTFTKITVATVGAVKHRKENLKLYKAINAVRYSEIAVSILTMQQSMLVSFGDGTDANSVILNAFTGALVCIFIFALGILTLKNKREEIK